MDLFASARVSTNEDRIGLVLDILKKQIDQYELPCVRTKSKTELARSQRIQQLVLQERDLSNRLQKMSKEIKHYERKYEKILKKRVKSINMQIKEEQEKLDIIKKKYQELNSQTHDAPCKIRYSRKAKLRNVNKPLKVKVMKPKFKRKKSSFHKSIKIKIKRNTKLDQCKMFFIRNTKKKHAFNEPVNAIEFVNDKTKECRIMLQRLTEDQVKQYRSPSQVNQLKVQSSRGKMDPHQEVNTSGKTVVQPSWHIKIPKEVFEESLRKEDNCESNVVFD